MKKILIKVLRVVMEIVFFVFVFVLAANISTTVVKPILRLMNPDWSPELLARYASDGPGAAMIGGIILILSIVTCYYCRKKIQHKLVSAKSSN